MNSESKKAKGSIIAKIITLLVVIVYCIIPDPFPGPIDDIIVAVLGVALQLKQR